MTSSPQMNKLTSKTRKAFLAAGLLSGAALSSLVVAAPANAACPTGQLLSTLTAGVTISCGDKDYTFAANPFTGFAPTDTFSIAQTFSSHTLSVLSGGGWTPGTYTLDYSITTTGANFLKAYNSAITTPDLTANATYTMTGSGLPSSSVANGPSMTAPESLYMPLLNSDAFTTTLQVNSGFITQITSAVRQGQPETVPGPLPLLGAGAAFGFSRRIRNRIKASA
jgi:hypothetical protein